MPATIALSRKVRRFLRHQPAFALEVFISAVQQSLPRVIDDDTHCRIELSRVGVFGGKIFAVTIRSERNIAMFRRRPLLRPVDVWVVKVELPESLPTLEEVRERTRATA